MRAILLADTGSRTAVFLGANYMFDRLLNGGLWLAVMGLITASAGAALMLAYRGLFNLCAGRYRAGSATVAAGIGLAAASYLLCRHGNDLMDR
jgi:hypothetical protein